jgi:PKD repeat protein
VAASIQKEASSFVLNNLTEIGLDRNYFEIESQRTNSGKYKLTVKASFSNTATYTWDLGNGEIKNEPKFEYYYKKPGIYRIKLSVNDFCGSRVYTRTVKYVAPPKPLKYPKSKPTKKVYTKRKN